MNFEKEVEKRITANGGNKELKAAAGAFLKESLAAKYSYNFSWLGRPAIQYPQDMLAMQELIWAVRPEHIIETGIARGGSLVFYAALLELNAACGGPKDAEVLGVDVEIRPHNRKAIEEHPLTRRIRMIEGSSADPAVAARVAESARGRKSVMVILDSDHTHKHVLAELNAYARLATVGSYCVVFDTVIEAMPADSFPGRPWGPGNSPATAVAEFLKTHGEFEADARLQDKLLVTAAPGGYLKRVR